MDPVLVQMSLVGQFSPICWAWGGWWPNSLQWPRILVTPSRPKSKLIFMLLSPSSYWCRWQQWTSFLILLSWHPSPRLKPLRDLKLKPLRDLNLSKIWTTLWQQWPHSGHTPSIADLARRMALLPQLWNADANSKSIQFISSLENSVGFTQLHTPTNIESHLTPDATNF